MHLYVSSAPPAAHTKWVSLLAGYHQARANITYYRVSGGAVAGGGDPRQDGPKSLRDVVARGRRLSRPSANIILQRARAVTSRRTAPHANSRIFHARANDIFLI